MSKILLFLLIVSIFVTSSHQLSNRKIRSKSEDKSYRLPNNSIPHHYKIQLIPHLVPDNFTFNGEVNISLEILKPSKNLTLHASSLTINVEETILLGKEEKFAPDEHDIDEERDFLVLIFPKELLPGNYTLGIKFSGVINDTDVGLFRNSYKNNNNETVYLVSTLFQSTFARTAFPCWDEPALKATFDISINHFPNYTALSNMPVSKIRNDLENDGKVWTDFKTTPIMSTYLVAFLVSDFKNYTTPESNLTVWSREKPSHTMDIVFKTVPKVIKILEKRTNIAFELPKQDHAAIPHVTEAIENWGLITYKEEDVLEEEPFSTKKSLAAILLVIHELCHQWFGNLVTPEWWKHLWLSEGFAQYTQYIVAKELLHEPRMMELFVAANKYEAFQLDSLSSGLALTPEVETPEEIDLAFGGLPYCKGASIVHTVRNIMSEEVFDAGIKKYLQSHKYKAVSTDDLWKSLSEALVEAKLPYSDLEIKKKMDPYLQQKGYPVVNVVRDYETGTVKFTQECATCKNFRNNSNGDNNNNTNKNNAGSDNKKWWIPINFVTNSSLNFSSTLPTHWMDPEEKELIIEGIDPNDWIIVNIQNSGYYRVNYDKKNWAKIAASLNSKNHSQIHALNKVQLLEDLYFLFKNDKITFADFINLFFYLHREVDFIPWISGFRILNELIRVTDNYFMTYTIKMSFRFMLQTFRDKVGFDENDSDDMFTLLAKSEGLKMSCDLGEKYCQEKAKEYVLNVSKNSNPGLVPPNYKDWILCSGIENSNVSVWNLMLEVYKRTNDENVLESLSCLNYEKSLTKYLNLIFDDDDLIPKNKILDVVCFAFKTDNQLTLNYVKTNHKKIKEKFNISITSIYEKLIYCSRTKNDLNKIETSLEEQTDQEISKIIKPQILLKKEMIEN